MAEYSLAELNASGIYQIRNVVNGKRYIGSTKCFRTRWNAHKGRLNNQAHHSKHLQSSWTKHGKESFCFEIVEFCAPSDLIEREQSFIDLLKPEFNICPTAGNSLGRTHSKESRQKIAEKAKGRKCGPRSESHRKKLSLVHLGKAKPEHVMAALQAGRKSQVFTKERLEKMSASLKNAYASGARSRTKTEQHRYKIGKFYAKISDDDVREIRRLKVLGVTGRELAARFNSNAGTISNICNGKRYKWVL